MKILFLLSLSWYLVLCITGCTAPQRKKTQKSKPRGILSDILSKKKGPANREDLYRLPDKAHTRWSSFENPSAEKGRGGMSNKGAKGRAFEALHAGETKVLLDVQGCGTVNRIWATVSKRDPVSLRSLRIEMFWDNAATPAVSVPFGDFFCHVHGYMSAFENDLFSSPESRSFNCCIPMPFRTAARITVTNDSDEDISHIFYDVNFVLTESHEKDVLYFHAHWRRERRTTPGIDFEILPRIEGSGRFLGTHVGVITDPKNIGWWGEGEFKAYLDGDTEYPTLAGTGTEDYIGTGWGQGVYSHRFQGCLLADGEKGMYSFYRYHVPDPVYFHSDCRITMQQIGGTGKKEVIAQMKKGVPIIPVSIDGGGGDKFVRLLDMDPVPDLGDESLPDGWTNHYRSDDWSAVAFFYLDSPENGLQIIQGVDSRTAGLERKQ